MFAHAPVMRRAGSLARSRRRRRAHFMPTMPPTASRNGSTASPATTVPRSSQVRTVSQLSVPGCSAGVTAGSSPARSAGGAIGGCTAAGLCAAGGGGGERVVARLLGRASDRTPASPDRPASPPARPLAYVDRRTSGGLSSSGGTTKPVATRASTPERPRQQHECGDELLLPCRAWSSPRSVGSGPVVGRCPEASLVELPRVVHRALDRVQLLEHRAIAGHLGCGLRESARDLVDLARRHRSQAGRRRPGRDLGRGADRQPGLGAVR